jgi:hypothetical protein
MKHWLVWGLVCAIAMAGLLTAPTLAQFNQPLLTKAAAGGGAAIMGIDVTNFLDYSGSAGATTQTITLNGVSKGAMVLVWVWGCLTNTCATTDPDAILTIQGTCGETPTYGTPLTNITPTQAAAGGLGLQVSYNITSANTPCNDTLTLAWSGKTSAYGGARAVAINNVLTTGAVDTTCDANTTALSGGVSSANLSIAPAAATATDQEMLISWMTTKTNVNTITPDAALTTVANNMSVAGNRGALVGYQTVAVGSTAPNNATASAALNGGVGSLVCIKHK